MRVVVQRVTRSAVVVNGVVVGRCGRGLNILLGVKIGDTQAEAEWLANKVANLRIFEDDHGKMNRSLLEIQGEALVISQFTLYGDARKGRRPAFTDAEAPEKASKLVDYFVEVLQKMGLRVETGVFGAFMEVEIHNDGPVTILLEKDPEP
ncbi:MAG TPA: D-aminoacyl-tRNA deacylase [Acidobacteriota bacterium]|nr:D-aminoacyl-tRNA deacylase [Acidobacteriota bacterium]